MIKKEFKKGDRVFLEKGYPVTANVAEKYIYSNLPFSEKLYKSQIILGLSYTTEEIAKRDIKEEANHIANNIFRSFRDYYYEIEFAVCKKFIEENIDINKKLECTEFLMPEGWFIIESSIFYPEIDNRMGWYPKHFECTAIRDSDSNKDEIVFRSCAYINGEYKDLEEIS